MALEWVPIGRLGRPHGLDGTLRLHPFHPDSPLLGTLQRLWVEVAPGRWEARSVQRWRRLPRAWAVRLTGIESRQQARSLTQRTVAVPRSLLPPPGDDEVYLSDLQGAEVVDERGHAVGTVDGALVYPSALVLRVRTPRGHRELPLLEPWLEAIEGDGEEQPFVVRVRRFEELPLQPGSARGTRPSGSRRRSASPRTRR